MNNDFLLVATELNLRVMIRECCRPKHFKTEGKDWPAI